MARGCLERGTADLQEGLEVLWARWRIQCKSAFLTLVLTLTMHHELWHRRSSQALPLQPQPLVLSRQAVRRPRKQLLRLAVRHPKLTQGIPQQLDLIGIAQALKVQAEHAERELLSNTVLLSEEQCIVHSVCVHDPPRHLEVDPDPLPQRKGPGQLLFEEKARFGRPVAPAVLRPIDTFRRVRARNVELKRNEAHPHGKVRDSPPCHLERSEPNEGPGAHEVQHDDNIHRGRHCPPQQPPACC
mmetsp:Transcript_86055/g.200095  ORF Transcript_86055/g.200095 Transcript_86055/m.200095 type:complete len:243 (+) Transcript_86055:113-841(+)